MAITTRNQSIDVTDATDLAITTATQDAVTGLWSRDVRVFDNTGVVFTLRITSSVKAALDIDAPTFPF